MVGDKFKHVRDTVLDLLLRGNTGRVDVVDTRADLVGVAVLFEGVKEFHVTLGSLNGDNIGVKVLDRGEDVVEIGVAEVRVGLESIGDTSGGELERWQSPREVSLPVDLAERELWREN